MKLFAGLVVLALAGLTGVLFAAATAPGQGQIRATAARIAELLAEAGALQARIRDLERAAAGGQADPGLVHRAASAPQATLMLQRSLVEDAARSNLVLSTFGGAPPPVGLTTPAVAVVLEGEGELADVARFLARLETRMPRLAVSQLSLRDLSRGRAGGGVAPVAFRIAAWGFWAAEGG